MKNLISLFLLLILLIIIDCRCKEKDITNKNFDLLTSTVWYKTQQCVATVDDKTNFTLFKPDGQCFGEFFGFFRLTWNLKDKGETLVLDQTEYFIEELSSTTLKLQSLQGCPMDFTAISTKVTADGVSDLTKTSADLHGCVATNNFASVSFEYGVLTTYGSTITPVNSSVSGMSYDSIECSLTGLLPETTYHYRFKAVNSIGTFYSKDLTFRTFNVETVSDPAGNTYNTITIGTQIWMAENLKTTKYRNGDPIPNVTDPIQWNNLTTGAYCNYGNDINNGDIYGCLYNWYTINDSRNIAPTGWHVANDEDWTTLTSATFIAGLFGSGSKIKECGTSHWGSPNISATNESGFTALAGGLRQSNGSFTNMRISGNWWSSTYNPDELSTWGLVWFNGNANQLKAPKTNVENLLIGVSVRCVKD